MRTLPLNALRTFKSAARHLNFADAAAELGVTAAAVSVQVRRLEKWVGVPLFIRRGRTVRLSPAGQQLATPLEDLFGQLEDLLVNLPSRSGEGLRISASPSVAGRWLAPQLGGFAEAHPDIRVRLSVSEGWPDFADDQAHLGLFHVRQPPDDLHSEVVARVRAVPVCSPELAVRYGADAAKLPDHLLLHDETARLWSAIPAWTDWFQRLGAPRSPTGGLWFSNDHLALAAAAAGQGFALAMSPLVETDLSAGRLARPFDLSLDSGTALWLLCRKDRLSDPLITAFRDWLLSDGARGDLADGAAAPPARQPARTPSAASAASRGAKAPKPEGKSP